MRTILALLTAMAMITGGCIGAEAEGGTRDEAIGLAEEFLSAVKAQDTDRAWSLVYPPNRSARFEDDLNTRELDAAMMLDLRAEQRLARGVSVYAALDNALDAEIETAETADGIESFGAPRALRLGLVVRR